MCAAAAVYEDAAVLGVVDLVLLKCGRRVPLYLKRIVISISIRIDGSVRFH